MTRKKAENCLLILGHKKWASYLHRTAYNIYPAAVSHPGGILQGAWSFQFSDNRCCFFFRFNILVLIMLFILIIGFFFGVWGWVVGVGLADANIQCFNLIFFCNRFQVFNFIKYLGP